MRYLTKSKFKLGLECPTKLFYTGKKEFPNQKQTDPFLMQLADGGFQVEAMARLKYEGGTMIENRDSATATQITNQLLHKEEVCIYEAGFTFKSLHVRSDIVQKKSEQIRLIEVKAKSSRLSINVNEEFRQKANKLIINWEAYLWDIAFQYYVIKNSFPNLHVSAHILLVDKDAKASIDGIHQKFKITQNGKDQRMNILIEDGFSYKNLGTDLLVLKDVTEIILDILDGTIKHSSNGKSFLENVEFLSDIYTKNIANNSPVGRQCKDCEFRLKDGQIESKTLKSGFNQCWIQTGKVLRSDLKKPKTYDIYSSNFSKKIMQEGVLLADKLKPEQLNNIKEKIGFSQGERQLLQLEDIKSGQVRKIFNEDALSEYKDKIKFPLNMIDFETSANALPFMKGLSPYETIAFQFSHHIVYKDGRVEHANQWICTDPFLFPNYEFVRALKKSLEVNEGSIFRYHNHENTVLNKIKRQLVASNELDKKELIEFIESITKYDYGESKLEGKRCMIDLHRLICDCYYNTEFAHSLSLKVVLPAVIRTDYDIQHKYSKAIETIQISSLNFENNHIWLNENIENGLDPYSTLPLPFEGYTDEQLADFFVDADDKISNGGTAMMVYAKMQYTEMTNEEREGLKKAMFKYCELDTLAMVILFEHLQNKVNIF